MLQPSIVLKVLLLGDGAVGKTALRERYLGRGFQSTYLMTIGADFALHKFERDNKQVKIQIWDLAGQERFQVVRAPYYSGAHGALLVYDVTRKETLENIDNWITEALKNTGKPIPLAFIGNKTDLRNPKDPSHLSENDGRSAIKKLVEKHKLNDFPVIYYETSAKTGENVAKGFESLTNVILSPKSSTPPEQKKNTPPEQKKNTPPEQKKNTPPEQKKNTPPEQKKNTLFRRKRK